MYMLKASALSVSGQTTVLTLAVCLQLKGARVDTRTPRHTTRAVYVFGCSQCRSATACLANRSQPLFSLVDSQGPLTLGTATDQELDPVCNRCVTIAMVCVDVVAHAPLVKIFPRSLPMFSGTYPQSRHCVRDTNRLQVGRP